MTTFDTLTLSKIPALLRFYYGGVISFTAWLHSLRQKQAGVFSCASTTPANKSVQIAPRLLAGLKGARYLLADKGYDANSLRKHLRQSAIVPVIPGHSNRKRVIRYDKKR